MANGGIVSHGDAKFCIGHEEAGTPGLDRASARTTGRYCSAHRERHLLDIISRQTHDALAIQRSERTVEMDRLRFPAGRMRRL